VELKKLTTKELVTFSQLVKLNQPSLKKLVSNLLKNNYDKVIETKHYVMAEGNIPIALVAHLDTVFISPPEEIYHDQNKNVMWSPDGLGADDRAGVYAIIKILKSGYRPHIIFTTDEEKGGIGASKLIKDYKECPFKELKYMIELDRRGTNDCVFYYCNNPQFVNYIEDYGFLENFGTYSDICEFGPAWGVAAVNLSIGYEDEHTCVERLFISRMLNTISKVEKMLDDADTAPNFIYIETSVAEYYKNYYANFYGDNWKEYLMEDGYKCCNCGREYFDEELFPTLTEEGDTVRYCIDCLVAKNNIEWCELCNNPFEVPKGKNYKICPFCRAEELGDNLK
jgi:hypothetical protein